MSLFSGNRFANVPDKIRDLVICLFLLFVVIKLYGSAVSLWFMEDDTQILKQAITHERLEYFTVPGAWRELSSNNFTPWVTLSFAIDEALFGLDAKMFYIHQLVAVWLCSIMLYFVLRLWTQPFVSFLGACLFLVGTPVAAVSQKLMTRHYIEGLLFSLLSVYFFVRCLRTGRFAWLFSSAFFYIAAMAAKEVYVPLVFVLMVLPEKNWKTRAGFGIPLLLLLLSYLFWRWWMLGALVGGYDASVKEPSWPSKISHIGTALVGSGTANTAALLIILFAASAYWIAGWRRFLFSLWVCLLVTAPVLTIPDYLFSYRHFFALWVMISILCAFVFRYCWSLKLRGRLAGVAFLAVVFAVTLSASGTAWTEGLSQSRHMSEDGKFYLLEADQDDILVHPAGPPWYYEGLDWLRHYCGMHRTPKVYYDDIYLCEERLQGKRIWTYSMTEGRETEISRLVPALRKAYCGKIRQDAELRVDVEYVHSTLRWQFGPYEKGEYAFILNAAQGKYSVPRSGAIKTRLTLDARSRFRVRYESPDGWITYSPVMILSGAGNHTTIKWERDLGAKD